MIPVQNEKRGIPLKVIPFGLVCCCCCFAVVFFLFLFFLVCLFACLFVCLFACFFRKITVRRTVSFDLATK